ncbi:MAG: HEAT repeat domain-containing protein [Phycisphaerae bacterium]|jgi:HEAT repeat protein|nr:HEAT repeat domain-containing protein [Phycisphaerae bacterium]MDP7287895.1 HEAT repeat domain-containing protein [Phycisphaerae bacterium]
MKNKAVLIASVCLLCGLVAYQSWGGFRWFERNAELIEMARRYRPKRYDAGRAKPMTLEMVRKSLSDDRGVKRMRAILASKRFIAEHPDLVPALVRIYVDRKADSRTAALAEMVIRGADRPLGGGSTARLVRVFQDRNKCCLTEEEMDDDPTERGLKMKHPVRYAALHMLCDMNSDVVGVVPSIIEADYSSGRNCLNVDRRRCLEWIGPGQRADVEVLTRLMFSDKARIRFDAAICLGYHRDASESVIPLLRGAMAREDSSGMRCAMLMSLARIAGRGELSAGIAANALGDPNCVVRADAAELLGDFKVDRKKHAGMLVKALDDFWPPVRRNAAGSLGRIGAAGPKVTDRLVTALDDEEHIVVLAAAGALIKLGSGRSSAVAVKLLKTHLADEDPVVRRAAVRTVARIGPKALGTVDSLAAMLGADDDWRATAEVCIAMGRLGPSAAGSTDALVELLENGDVHLGRIICEALGNIGSVAPGAVQKLRAIMNDPSRDIARRTAAAGTLLGLARGDVEDALEFLRARVKLHSAMDHWPIELLAGYQPMSEPTAAVLGQFIADYRDKPWSSSVSGVDQAVLYAAEGLGRSKDPKTARSAIGLLVRMMKTGRLDLSIAAVDPNDPLIAEPLKRGDLGRYEYRRMAIESLGRLGPIAAGAAEHLSEMINWKDLRLARPARAALERVTSET